MRAKQLRHEGEKRPGHDLMRPFVRVLVDRRHPEGRRVFTKEVLQEIVDGHAERSGEGGDLLADLPERIIVVELDEHREDHEADARRASRGGVGELLEPLLCPAPARRPGPLAEVIVVEQPRILPRDLSAIDLVADQAPGALLQGEDRLRQLDLVGRRPLRRLDQRVEEGERVAARHVDLLLQEDVEPDAVDLEEGELDEEGNPRKKGAPKRKTAAHVRKKAPAKRKALAPKVIEAEPEIEVDEIVDIDEADPTGEKFMAARAAARRAKPVNTVQKAADTVVGQDKPEAEKPEEAAQPQAQQPEAKTN